MQRQFRLGEGVVRRAANLRGQSIIEYVLIIAIVGLAVVFAGPQAAGAIRNEFETVVGAIESGTSGEEFQTEEEKALVSASRKSVSEWSISEQKAAAEDISQNGENSICFSKAKAAMDAGTRLSCKLTNGRVFEYRIIGINHDDLIDGSGKAGLTFEATSDFSGGLQMNSTDSNLGGWEKSDLRQRLNSGDLWSLFPSELAAEMKQVAKVTDNTGGGKTGKPSVTADKVFLLSVTEVFGNKQSDGVQYEYYADKGVNITNFGGASSAFYHWTRTAYPERDTNFRCIYGDGGSSVCRASGENQAFPAFCF